MRLFLLLLFMIPYFGTNAGVRIDSSYSTIQHFNEADWERHTKDLKYPSPQKMIVQGNRSFNLSTPEWIKYMVFILIIAFLVFLIYKIIKILYVPTNRKVKSDNFKYDTAEDIEEDSSILEKYLSNAITSKDYRKAIRYSYLIAIRDLALNKLITKSKDKTNYEYLGELTNHPVFNSFRDITRAFEKSWYGELNPMQIEYIQFENNFNHFLSSLSGAIEK